MAVQELAINGAVGDDFIPSAQLLLYNDVGDNT